MARYKQRPKGHRGNLSPNIDPQDEDFIALQKNVNSLYEKCAMRAEELKDEAEKAFYRERCRSYLKDMPNLNASGDLDDLHAMVIELITQKRLLKIANENNLPLPQEYSDSVKRWTDIKKSLAGSRVDRKRYPEKGEDFQSMIQGIFNQNEEDKIVKDNNLLSEEEGFMKEKKDRDIREGIIND